MGFIGDAIDSIFGGGDDAADASRDASNASVAAQREALAYLKEREAIPQQFREGALTQLGGLAGISGGTGSQQSLVNKARSSPLYASIMSGKNEGEASILRNAAATGGLRSGNVQGAMYNYNTDLQTQALLESYNKELSNLQGLAGLSNNTDNIASTMAGIGNTQAQGITAAATGVAWTAQKAIFPAISGAGVEIGSQIAFRFFRDPTDIADTYPDDAAITMTLGFHYEIDTPGSRQITTK